MARRTKEVNRSWLEACIREAEKDGPIDGGIVALHKVVCDLYNANDQIPEKVTYSVIGLRINQWKLPFITTAGKRGRPGGNPNIGTMTRSKKADRFASDETIIQHFVDVKRQTPQRFLPVLEQVQQGSRTAAVKLNCLECSGYVTKEVRLCGITTCALWAFRPYQGKPEQDEDADVPEEIDEKEMTE